MIMILESQLNLALVSVSVPVSNSRNRDLPAIRITLFEWSKKKGRQSDMWMLLASRLCVFPLLRRTFKDMKLILDLALVAGCLSLAVGQDLDLAPASFDPQELSPAIGTSDVPANAPASVLALPDAGQIGSTAPGPGLKGHLFLMKLHRRCRPPFSFCF